VRGKVQPVWVVDGISGPAFTSRRNILGKDPSPMQFALASLGHAPSNYCKIFRRNHRLSLEVSESEKVKFTFKLRFWVGQTSSIFSVCGPKFTKLGRCTGTITVCNVRRFPVDESCCFLHGDTRGQVAKLSEITT